MKLKQGQTRERFLKPKPYEYFIEKYVKDCKKRLKDLTEEREICRIALGKSRIPQRKKVILDRIGYCDERILNATQNIEYYRDVSWSMGSYFKNL